MTARLTLFALFVATVIAANWALNHYGIVSIGFGLTAPAGVYAAGLAFGLRDALHESGGRRWVYAAIGTGAAVSYLIEDAARIPGGLVPIAVASALAFTVSELADLAVYEPLRRRSLPMRCVDPTYGPARPWNPPVDHKRWVSAVVASNIVGAIVDSALFLWLAFGSLDHITGQIVGKTYMIALALPIVWISRAVLARNA